MTQQETDDMPDDRTTAERFRAWRDSPASVTNGHLLVSRVVWTFFLATSAFVGYRQLKLDNQLTADRIEAAIVRESDNCQDRNERRTLARGLAEEALQADQNSLDRDQHALDSDVATWTAIDDLFDNGIPEPARTTVFNGLEDRQHQIEDDQEQLDGRTATIETAYELEPCPAIADGAGSSDDTQGE